ncbi:MAG TPA: hypothetical protein VK018_04605, partial [Porticoccaceae bacterium]|nr:hypothetical protein [Porticoccaceae bacterium]
NYGEERRSLPRKFRLIHTSAGFFCSGEIPKKYIKINILKNTRKENSGHLDKLEAIKKQPQNCG